MTTDQWIEVSKAIITGVQAVATIILTGVGVFLVHNWRRQLELKMVDKRLEAYSSLWEEMEIASPMRLQGLERKPLSEKERFELYDKFTSWYYENGNGMLILSNTRNLYLQVKENLICPVEKFEPELSRKRLKKISWSTDRYDRLRGELSIRQLSLLRTRMKADLAIYGIYFFGNLTPEDKELLKACGEDLYNRPWGGKPGEQVHSSKRDAAVPE
jgi:hypothetical protein